ncbi:hypothetical protein OIU78_002019 [Salix suchowensis]|nr:hypothetical protein OIU78_002019 [Salix suchowensis]
MAIGLKNGLIYTGKSSRGYQGKVQTSSDSCLYSARMLQKINALDFSYFRADDSSTPRLNQDKWLGRSGANGIHEIKQAIDIHEEHSYCFNL